ncbi:MAG: hypothetical protein ACXU7D_09365 [Burkholderiaceae bacterium]
MLYTKFPRKDEKTEFTDIVFDGVVAIQLDEICLTQSILGEIYERTPVDFFDAFEDVFKVEEKWGNKFSYLWLPFKYEDKEDFAAKIQERSLLCFEIDSSWGLNGFVIGTSYSRISRESEAEIV